MLLALVSSVALAASSPLQVVKAGNEQLQKLIAEGKGVEPLAAQAEQFIDFAELARRALGEQWAKLKPKQQDEFTATMKGLLRASYAKKAIDQGKQGEPAWGAEKVTGDEASVSSSILVSGDKFPIEYKLARGKSGWKIYDVITDGVSLVDTYADQFRSLISKKGYDGLLETLKKRREQLEAPAAQSGAK
ncbi:MAG: ABC transporter substrate-binding protein [Archangiaceae bacterium]|nr:ABC transporter substrate-binding protein [Archangiaceae bacterium]